MGGAARSAPAGSFCYCRRAVPLPVTVAALAVADGPADAVGVVQLACEDDALALTLLRAGAYRDGFVPGTLATSVTLRVPYGAVRGLVRRGRALVLTLDRSVPSPFHRFALARFTDDPAETLAPLHRAHRLASTLSWALPGPLGALSAALPPASLVGGALGRASLAVLVALLSGAVMRAIAAWLAWGGPVSDRHREAFEAALAERLGLLPRRPSPELRPPPDGLRLPPAMLRHQLALLRSQPAPLRKVTSEPHLEAAELHRRSLELHHQSLDLHHQSLDLHHQSLGLHEPSLPRHEVVPDPRATIPDPREILADPREVMPDPRATIPDPREIVTDLRETIPDPRETIPDPRETIPDPREMVAAHEIQEPAREPRRLMPAAPPQIDLTPRHAPRVPWARLVGLAAVVALGAVSAFAFVRRYGTTTAAPAPEIDDTVTAARGEIPPKPPPPPPPPPEERCFCGRADSPLWRDGVPVLSVMTTTGPDGTLAPPQPKLDEHDNPVFQYDLAVVNNGAATLRETRIVLTYARRDAEDRRIAVTDRGLYWGKPLAPGRAVKWVTEGPGTEVRIDKSEPGTLEERGIEPAPADAFFALTRARHRVVRMHAAMMLAYLHDPRAEEALASIGAPQAVEAWTVRRIRAAAKPFIPCDIQAVDGRITACVFNSSTKPGTGLSLREIQDDEAKPGRAWPVQVEVPIHDGVRLAWPIEGDPPGDLVVHVEP